MGAFSFSQTIDSLKLDTLISVLTYEKSDIRTVDAYNELSTEYLRVEDYLTALTYSELALDMAGDIGYRNAKFEATCSVAHINMAYLLDFRNALKYYRKALDLALISKSNEELIQVYRGISSVYSGVLNYEVALTYNQKAIELAKSMNDDLLLSDLKAYEGAIYEDLGDTSLAIVSYEEVLHIEEGGRFENTTLASMETIGHYYSLIGDFLTSLKYYRIALKKSQRNQDNRWVAYIHSQMAEVYLSEGNFPRAEKHGLAGLEIAEKFQFNKERADNYKVLSDIYQGMGNDSVYNIYSTSYKNLMDSVLVDLDHQDLPELESTKPDQAEKSSNSSINGFLQAILISFIVGFFVFISGLTKRSSIKN